MKQDSISIVTVCFNARETIESTIQSVLSQDYPGIEYIIIDGGSSDGTQEIISRYADQISLFISEKDNGIYDAMNKGLAAASGEWIHFRNAGDLFLSERSLSLFFEKKIDKEVQIVFGDCIYINEWGYRLMKPGILTHNHKTGMPVLHPATFVRTAYHKQHPFDLSFQSSGDYKFMYECFEDGIRMEYRPIPVASFPTGGFAMKNLKRTYREDCRIQGLDKSFWGRIQSGIGYGILCIKLTALNLCTHFRWLQRIRKRMLKSRNWKDLPVPIDQLYSEAHD